MPADWRYNPYTGVMESVSITDETHVIPSNAPYYIRLSEVPEKTAPSTLTIRFEDNTELTEVAANPEPGQFWPDYNTSDEDINSGLIRFNAADAGKIVKANYKGNGTLASAKNERYPSWWFERGDGSLGNKVCTNGEVLEGVYNFKNFTIPTGVTIYINKSAVILCLGIFKNDGVINGVGRGATGTSEDARDRAVSIGYFGGGAGWWGSTTETATGEFSGSAPSWAISIFEKQQHLRFYGGAGSAQYSKTGGNGGAGLAIIAKYCIGTGVYTMDGGPPGGSGGGSATYGGGGIVYVLAETINGTKTASVAGSVLGWFKFRELGVV